MGRIGKQTGRSTLRGAARGQVQTASPKDGRLRISPLLLQEKFFILQF